MKYFLEYNLLFLIIFTPFFHSDSQAQTPVQALVNTGYKNIPGTINVLKENEFRKVVDLNGEWEVKLGRSAAWNKVNVPSSIDFKGDLFFRKSVFLPANIGSFHSKLFALGINNTCNIKINGIFVGSYSGGYSSFSIDLLDSVLKPGQENLIEIDVVNDVGTNSPTHQRPLPWGWKSYGGIIREIYILLQPKVTLTDWTVDYSFNADYSRTKAIFNLRLQNFFQTSEGDSQSSLSENIQEIGYYLEIFNKSTNSQVKSTISTPKFINIHKAIEDTVILNFNQASLWSPENPAKYRITINLLRRNRTAVDKVVSEFGFRDVQMRTDGFYLNGSKITLAGIYRIEQHPRYGVSLPYEALRQDLILIKNLGLNAIRSGPYPNHPYFYELCDEMGILVFEEIPVYYVPDAYINTEEFVDQAELYVEKMIKRDRHHPSVMAWGIGSGLQINKVNTDNYINGITAFARNLDNRPLYFSTNSISVQNVSNNADFVFVDSFSPDITAFQDAANRISQQNVSKPVFFGRIGPDVFPQNLRGYQNKTSIAHQAKYIGDLYNLLQDNSNVPGVFFWSFADWKGDIPSSLSGYENAKELVYFRGLVTEDRVERQAYQYLQSTINASELAPLTLGVEEQDSQKVLVFTGFGLILAMVIALKQHRWFGENYRRSILYSKNFFEDVINRRNMQVWQTLMLAFAIALTLSIGIAGYSFFFRRDIIFDFVISQFLFTPGIKKVAIFFIWNPLLNIFTFTLLIIGVLVVKSFLLNIIQMFFGISKGTSFALNIMVWTGSHLVFAIPLSMAIYSALDHSASFTIYLLAGLVLFALYVWRYIVALKVAYKNNFNRALICSLLLIITFWGSIALYYQSKYQSFTYVNSFISGLSFQE